MSELDEQMADWEVAMAMQYIEGFNKFMSEKTKDELIDILQIFETFEEYEKCAMIRDRINKMD